MSDLVIRNGTVLNDNRLCEGNDVVVRAGRIERIAPSTGASGGGEIDATGCYVLPGLVDLHNHGLRHVAVQSDSLCEYSRLLLEQGVTACVATLVGGVQADIETMRRGLRETDSFRLTPNIVGFRPEILYVAKTGAGAASSLTSISADTTQAMYEAGEGWIKIWDVSPELEGAISFIRWAVERGIVVSMAHTSASIEQARRAVDAGLSLVTHLYDTFDVPVEMDMGVYPAGLTDYVQVEDRLMVEIVPDGVHVHPLLVEKTFRCKGIDRIAFITDGVRGAGNPPGVYDGLYEGVTVEITANRGVRRLSDDALSGSALTQLQSLRNAVLKFGRSLPEASALCSRTPARVLGLERKGRLAPGMDADIIVLDADLNLCYTILGGKVVYRGEG